MSCIGDIEYDGWHVQKKMLAHKADRLLFKEMEIWWCAIGMNLGGEVYGKGNGFRRPVLVLKKLSENLCIVLPMSTKKKVGTWFTRVNFHNKQYTVCLYQIRVVDAHKRFYKKIATVNVEEFVHIKEKLKLLLEIL